ncbi:MAG: NADH-quinone oxidoreductase subunit C [Acidimicrobiia bacterium]|nr:NADH-quinone oxidoreductase subunit C [Acidimicrobiia bacterium]
MTTNPPEETDATEEVFEAAAADHVAAFAERVAGIVESGDWSAAFGNAKVRIDRSRWVEAVTAVRDGAGLDFFSFLSAIDWSNEVAVGEPLAETVEERYEVLVRLSNGRNNDAVTLSTEIPKDDARLPTLVGVFEGANWHEREAAEMFGIRFEGHPNPGKLYLTDEFEGFPLRKSYPLVSREVKPWPGMVDVEDMPSTENPEAGSGGVEEQLPGNAEGVSADGAPPTEDRVEEDDS